MKVYLYQRKDYSLVTPIFKKVFINPIVDFIPWGVPANIITMLSSGFMYAALFFTLNESLIGRHRFWVISLLLLFYLVCDHLDGAQAKRTNTSSPLGEFLNHYLGAFNNGILIYILFSLFKIDNTLLLVSTLLFSYLAHTAIFYEQFKTGELVFEKLGSLEGVLASSFLIAICYFDPIYQLMLTTAGSRLNVPGVFFVIISIGAIYTFIKTLIRVNSLSYMALLFVVLIVITALLTAVLYSTFAVAIIVTLYACLYIGRLIFGHLTDDKQRMPDIFIPIFLMVVQLTDAFADLDTVYFTILYLLIRIAIFTYQSGNALKAHWLWTNPAEVKKDTTKRKTNTSSKTTTKNKSIKSSKATNGNKATEKSKTPTKSKTTTKSKIVSRSKTTSNTKTTNSRNTATKSEVIANSKTVEKIKPIIKSKAPANSNATEKSKPVSRSKAPANSKPTVKSKPVPKNKTPSNSKATAKSNTPNSSKAANNSKTTKTAKVKNRIKKKP